MLTLGKYRKVLPLFLGCLGRFVKTWTEFFCKKVVKAYSFPYKAYLTFNSIIIMNKNNLNYRLFLMLFFLLPSLAAQYVPNAPTSNAPTSMYADVQGEKNLDAKKVDELTALFKKYIELQSEENQKVCFKKYFYQTMAIGLGLFVLFFGGILGFLLENKLGGAFMGEIIWLIVLGIVWLITRAVIRRRERKALEKLQIEQAFGYPNQQPQGQPNQQ